MRYGLILVAAVLACGASVQSASVIGIDTPHLIGGARVNALNREFAVLLRLQKDYRKFDYCNGVRLNERWILTAAECLNLAKYTHVRLAYPIKGQFVYKYYQLKYGLKKVLHPQYDPKTKENNVALITGDFGWGDKSTQLQFPSGNDATKEFIGSVAEVTSVEHTKIRTDLIEDEEHAVNMITVEVAKTNVCAGKFDKTILVSEQICATPYFTGSPRALTQEDIGAPLVLKERILLGIASQASPSSRRSDEPMVFHKINPYVAWINKTMQAPPRD